MLIISSSKFISSPYMGIACLKAYINEKLPNIEVKTLDLRPFAPKEIWCPSDTPSNNKKKIMLAISTSANNS
ncbi:MAG: hypothetical protein U0457_05330 [Candidatus Sericytochromatia bacterium]